MDDIGHADAQEFDARLIVCARWSQWEIKLDPQNGALDLDGLRRREFTEI